MKNLSVKKLLALGLAGAIGIGAALPASAAPLGINSAAMKAATAAAADASQPTEVRYRGRYRRGGGNAAAAAAAVGVFGAIAGIAAANANRDRYNDGYYRGRPAGAYYRGGYGYGGGCPYSYTVQDGVCKPYRGY